MEKILLWFLQIMRVTKFKLLLGVCLLFFASAAVFFIQKTQIASDLAHPNAFASRKIANNDASSIDSKMQANATSLVDISEINDKPRADYNFDDGPRDNVEADGWKSFSDEGKADFGIAEDGRDGCCALSVSVKSDEFDKRWDVQVVRENVPVTAHEIFIYSAWVKGPRGAEVGFAVESPDFLNYEYKLKILAGGWQLVAFEFEAEGGEVRIPIHFGSSHNNGAYMLIDDVQVKPLDSLSEN